MNELFKLSLSGLWARLLHRPCRAWLLLHPLNVRSSRLPVVSFVPQTNKASLELKIPFLPHCSMLVTRVQQKEDDQVAAPWSGPVPRGVSILCCTRSIGKIGRGKSVEYEGMAANNYGAIVQMPIISGIQLAGATLYRNRGVEDVYFHYYLPLRLRPSIPAPYHNQHSHQRDGPSP